MSAMSILSRMLRAAGGRLWRLLRSRAGYLRVSLGKRRYFLHDGTYLHAGTHQHNPGPDWE